MPAPSPMVGRSWKPVLSSCAHNGVALIRSKDRRAGWRCIIVRGVRTKDSRAPDLLHPALLTDHQGLLHRDPVPVVVGGDEGAGEVVPCSHIGLPLVAGSTVFREAPGDVL